MRAPLIRARQAGFTLIEIMIALLIGMIGIVVMMQTFAISEGYKRTATSGTDAQVNGAVALYMLERELRMAGYGMNTLSPLGCQYVVVWNNTSGTAKNVYLFPFMINPPGYPAGDANTDVIQVAYGRSDSFVVGIQADQASPTADFNLNSNRDSFHTGDLFVSVQPGGGPGGNASCVLHEATKVSSAQYNCSQAAPSPLYMLQHAAATYKNSNQTCSSITATYNSSTGIKDTFGTSVPVVKLASGGQVFNLGQLQVKVYAIRGGNLTFCDAIAADCTQVANYNVIVNDVVSLRAVYGVNLTPSVTASQGDGKVAVPFSRIDLTTNIYYPSRVLAAAIEVTARSSLKEKPTSGTTCDATPTATRPDRAQDWLYQSVAGAGIDLSGVSADWNCYRYKLFQTNVPLRNMIWRP